VVHIEQFRREARQDAGVPAHSQLQALQEPASDEAALTLSGDCTIDEMVPEVCRWLQQSDIRSTR
jgi:Gluconate kinase